MNRITLALAAFLGLLGTTMPVRAQTADMRPNIAYGTDPVQRLDLCLPPGNQSGLRPAVLMIHGGYWMYGQKSDYAGWCNNAALQGIVAASIDYRLADGSLAHRWPAQIVDAQLAVRWLRVHAAEFRIDPNHICALGESAGGHLALFLAALDRILPGDYARELPGVSARVACAVDNYGPTDLTTDTFWPPDQNLFGSDGKTRPTEQERAASPLFIIGPHTAPVMIAHGRQDKAVPLDQSLRLYERLKQYGVPAHLHQVDADHGFAGLPWQQIAAIYRSEFDFIKHPH